MASDTFFTIPMDLRPGVAGNLVCGGDGDGYADMFNLFCVTFCFNYRMGDNAIVFIVNGICAGNLVLLFTVDIMAVWGDPNILYLYLPICVLIVFL